jgi:hypothetical protein
VKLELKENVFSVGGLNWKIFLNISHWKMISIHETLYFFISNPLNWWHMYESQFLNVAFFTK